MSVIKNNIHYSKIVYKEAPLLVAMVIYILLLSCYWQTIRHWLSPYNIFEQFLLLSMAPVFFWIGCVFKEKRAKRERILIVREPSVLPKHYIDHMKVMLANNQILLFESVLLPTLSYLYKSFDDINELTYFDNKFESLCKILKKIRVLPEIYSQHANLAKDTALTAFVFYRVLFHQTLNDYISFLNTQGHRKPLQDPHLLIKRVPEKLIQLLGAEYWRLYEFYEIVYGELNHIRLNVDLKDNLCSFFTQDKSENHEETSANKDDADHFIDWLESKLSSHHPKFRLNTNGFVFVAPLFYGDNTVFVTESLFNEYYRSSQIDSNQIKATLSSQRLLDPDTYFLKRNDQKIALFKLSPIHFPKTTFETVSIEKLTKSTSEHKQYSEKSEEGV